MRAKGKKFLRNEVKEIVNVIAGQKGVEIFENLPEERYINEFQLADKVKMHVNFVRSVLYRFYSKKIVVYGRKRDIKRGWYIYYWKLLPDKLKLMLLSEKKKRLEQLQNQLGEMESVQWMRCPACNKRFSYEKALESNFQCLECKKVLNTARAGDSGVKKEIRQLEKEIEMINNIGQKKISEKKAS